MKREQERFLPIHRVSWSEISPSASDNRAWERWVNNRLDLPKLVKEASTEAFLETLRRKVVRRNSRNGKGR